MRSWRKWIRCRGWASRTQRSFSDSSRIRIGIKARWEKSVELALYLATRQGRMKFCRRLFKEVMEKSEVGNSLWNIRIWIFRLLTTRASKRKSFTTWLPRTALTCWLTLEMLENWGWRVFRFGIRKRRKFRRERKMKRSKKRNPRKVWALAEVPSSAPKLPMSTFTAPCPVPSTQYPWPDPFLVPTYFVPSCLLTASHHNSSHSHPCPKRFLQYLHSVPTLTLTTPSSIHPLSYHSFHFHLNSSSPQAHFQHLHI